VLAAGLFQYQYRNDTYNAQRDTLRQVVDVAASEINRYVAAAARGELSQDEQRRLQHDIQQVTDDRIKRFDDPLAQKDTEILQV
jgi:ribosome recycling factor